MIVCVLATVCGLDSTSLACPRIFRACFTTYRVPHEEMTSSRLLEDVLFKKNKRVKIFFSLTELCQMTEELYPQDPCKTRFFRD